MNVPGDHMENMIGLSSRFMYNIPFTGLMLRIWGVKSIDPNNLTALMKSGKKRIGITAGGFEEAAITTPKELRVYIENRKGFIKYAIKYGYTLRPTLVLK